MAETLEMIEQKGFRLNKTIQKEIEQQFRSLGTAAAVRVRGAIEAVLAQDHNARNKGGMLVAAIRAGWEPTTKKVIAEDRYAFSAPPPPEDLTGVIMGIDLECDRLGWSRDQAIKHMVARYKWRPISFANLMDSDLHSLLDELRVM